MEDGDKEEIDDYMSQYYKEAEELNGHVVIGSISEEPFFTNYPAFGLPCVVDLGDNRAGGRRQGRAVSDRNRSHCTQVLSSVFMESGMPKKAGIAGQAIPNAG